MRPTAPTPMIGACPMDGLTPDGEEPTVTHDMSHPYIKAAMAAERRRRLLAEAEQRRRIAQLDRGHGRRFTRLEVVIALRNDAITWTGRCQAWRATWWHDRLSMSSTS